MIKINKGESHTGILTNNSRANVNSQPLKLPSVKINTIKNTFYTKVITNRKTFNLVQRSLSNSTPSLQCLLQKKTPFLTELKQVDANW